MQVFIAILNNSIDAKQQNLNITQGFSLNSKIDGSKMQKKTMVFIAILNNSIHVTQTNLNITQGFSLTSTIDGSTMSKTHRFSYVFWITRSKILILRKVFHSFQAHVAKNLRKYNDSLTKCHKTMRNLMFFDGFRAQEAWGCLGNTRRVKNLQIDNFFNRKFKGIRHLSGPADFAPRFGGQVQESPRMLSNHPEAKKSGWFLCFS